MGVKHVLELVKHTQRLIRLPDGAEDRHAVETKLLTGSDTGNIDAAKGDYLGMARKAEDRL